MSRVVAASIPCVGVQKSGVVFRLGFFRVRGASPDHPLTIVCRNASGTWGNIGFGIFCKSIPL